jgi:hypothetical protein
MHRSTLTVIAIVCIAAAGVTLSGYPSVFPTGVTRYDPARAYNCYVLFGTFNTKTHLIDMNGNVVREWPYTGFPSEMLDPEVTGGKRGHVLVQLTQRPGNGSTIFRNKSIGELDWDGKTVWEWGDKAPGGIVNQDHDWYRLANGNTLVLAGLVHSVPGFTAQRVNDQVIYEVSPAGDVVWKWVSSDHLEEFGFSAEGLDQIRKGSTAAGGAINGFMTVNNMHVLGPNRWFKAGDQRFDPENIMIDTRNGNFTAIIEKKSGKIVWRLGPYYPRITPMRRVPRAVDQISGQHDAHIIAEGLPGAGNLLLFDNQGEAGFPPATLRTTRGSRVLEIDPIKKEIVWEYSGETSDSPPWTFYSSFISSARRLPNGNTLIDEGMNGRFFQITRTGEIVWEYVSPYFSRGGVAGARPTPDGPQPVLTNMVYRAQPVPYDWVPEGTAHSEKAVVPPDLSTFRVPAAK